MKKAMLVLAATLTAVTLSVSVAGAQAICVTYDGTVCEGQCCMAIGQFCITWQCDY